MSDQRSPLVSDPRPDFWHPTTGCCPPGTAARTTTPTPSRSGSPRTAPPGCAAAVVEDAIIALRALVEHRDDVVHTRTQTVNRLHVLLTQLLPGGAPRQLDADTAARLLRTVRPRASGPRTLRRLAAELITEIRHLDRRIAAATTEISTAVAGQRHHPDPAARHRRPDRREDPGPGRGHHPVPLRGRVRLLHRHRADRGLLRRRRAPPTLPGRGPPAQLLPAHHGHHPNPARRPRPGPTTCANAPRAKGHKEALRCLKRRLSDVVYRRLCPRRGDPAGDEPGRTPGGDYALQRGRLNPYRRLFGQVALSGPRMSRVPWNFGGGPVIIRRR